MLFILKKKKEKKKKQNVSNRNIAHKPILHQTGKEEEKRAMEDSGS